MYKTDCSSEDGQCVPTSDNFNRKASNKSASPQKLASTSDDLPIETYGSMGKTINTFFMTLNECTKAQRKHLNRLENMVTTAKREIVKWSDVYKNGDTHLFTHTSLHNLEEAISDCVLLVRSVMSSSETDDDNQDVAAPSPNKGGEKGQMRIDSTEREFQMSPLDQEEMTRVSEVVLPRCIEDLNSDSRSYSKLLSERKSANKLLLAQTLFTEDVVGHANDYYPDSREWVMQIVMSWVSEYEHADGIVDDVVDKADEQGIVQFSDPLAMVKILRKSAQFKLFWLRGHSGCGKSTIAASLVQRLKLSSQLLCAYFFKYGMGHQMSVASCIRSLAAQCMEYLPEAKHLFIKAARSVDEMESDACTLFQNLIVEPLGGLRAGVHRHMVIVLDGIDEIGDSADDRVEVMTLFSQKLNLLPYWVRVVVASSPEEDIVKVLEKLQPTQILENDPRLVDDLQEHIQLHMQSRVIPGDLQRSVALFMTRSEGRFIYLPTIKEEFFRLQKNALWSYNDVDGMMPQGIKNSYRKLFTSIRQHSVQPTFYDSFTSRLIQLCLGAFEPLSVADIELFLNVSRTETKVKTALQQLHNTFPIRMYKDRECFVPFHKSVVDWFRDENQSGNNNNKGAINFHVSKEKSNKLFIDIFKQFLDMAVSLCFHLPFLILLIEEKGLFQLISLLVRFGAVLKNGDHPDADAVQLLHQLLKLSAPALKNPLNAVVALPTQLIGRITPGLLHHRMLHKLYVEADMWKLPSGYWLKPCRPTLISPRDSSDIIVEHKEVLCIVCSICSFIYIYVLS
jgi:hypothetical protein